MGRFQKIYEGVMRIIIKIDMENSIDLMLESIKDFIQMDFTWRGNLY
ncbi:unnamed protein product [Paramecium sonneborni]|uniref:Uncharacterized protein n=1 Tax=Paramecium sonneborni TaxID=65129 RepID=A0A8S1QPP7_9CILI|nr:unnamed protein product [Paramecium sonneborni]